MTEITIKAPCGTIEREDGKPVDLKEVDGIEANGQYDTFSDYFPDKTIAAISNNPREKVLAPLNGIVTGGYMSFQLNPEGAIDTITVYESSRKLTGEEAEALADYTQSQWSDGIGEGFEQDPVDGYFISPWFFGQVATVEQIDK